MNDIIAKRTNDVYLIRCAQILNNKRYIQVHKVKGKDGKERLFYFVTAEGINGPEGKAVPFEDKLDTIVFVRNNKSIIMMLLNTNYRIKLQADDERCYYTCKDLGIEFRYENILLNDDYSIEKNRFELKSENSRTTVSYAINEDSIVEIIYYYEMKKDQDGYVVENFIMNDTLKQCTDAQIEAYMKELHELYIENEPENAEGEQEDPVSLSELQADDSIPDDIRKMLQASCDDRAADMEGKSHGEFGLRNSILLSVADRNERVESSILMARVQDMYAKLYRQANIDKDDCFDVVDLFGNHINTRDYEIEENQYCDGEFDYDEYEEEDEQPEYIEFGEDDCERFMFSRRERLSDEDSSPTEKIKIDQEEKIHIISTITAYVVEKNFEFSDFFHLIQPMIRIFEEIETDFKEKSCVDKDIDD